VPGRLADDARGRERRTAAMAPSRSGRGRSQDIRRRRRGDMHDLCARSGARWGLQAGGAKLSEERSEGPRDQPPFEEGGSREPSDEELRARLEEELKRITAKDIPLQTGVT